MQVEGVNSWDIHAGYNIGGGLPGPLLELVLKLEIARLTRLAVKQMMLIL